MSGTSTDNTSVMVSISAVSAVQDTIDQDIYHTAGSKDVVQSTSSASFAPSLSISSAQDTAGSNITATTSDLHQVPVSELSKNDIGAHLSKLPIILLPPAETEPKPTDDNNGGGVSESIDPLPSSNGTLSKQGAAKTKTGTASAGSGPTTSPKTIAKPATTAAAGTKKSLSASTGRTTGATTATSLSAGRTKPASSSLTKTALTPSSATKQRPAIPDSLKRSATASSANSSTTASRTSSNIGITSSTKSLSPSSTTSQIRKSPSTPSLSGSPGTRSSTSTGRRVASSSGADPVSPPSGTPGLSRSPSQASITAVTSTTKRVANSSTATAKTASSATCKKAQSSLAPSPTPRQTPNGTSSFSKATARAALSPTPTPTSARKTTTSTAASTIRSVTATPTRPVTDAAKVKMLSTQLSGLQEKHEHTLKLLQEQEERMKRELEELSIVPEPQRRPISSDVQDVLKEMEELRKQFNDAKAEHEKALEDLATERALEVSQIKEAHEALLLALTKEKDSVTESLKLLEETGELTSMEKDARIEELEEQIQSSIERHADAVSKHAEALETLRVEIESSWAKKHEAIILDLTKSHEERIKSMSETAAASGTVQESELQKLKDEMDLQIRELEDEQENRVLELIAMHDLEVQEWKDKLRNQADEHEEALEHMRQDHAEAIENLTLEVEIAQASKANTDSELDRINSETRGELDRVRAEMEQIRKLLALKENEVAELTRRVEELTHDLEGASMSTLLKDTKKYKIKDVQVYGSSVSGNLKIKRAQQSLNDTLEQLDIQYEFVDVSVSEEAKKYMRRKNGGEIQLPQIFSGSEYRGLFEDFEYAIETHQVPQFLGFDRVRPFIPRHKIEFDLNRARLAQYGDADQNSTGAQRPRSKTDIGTSMYLHPPGSKQFLAPSSPPSNGNGSSRGSPKAGFVQAASQVWDGAMREDITQVQHDLGISRQVIADDEELDELFEQGAVSAEELEAMMDSM